MEIVEEGTTFLDDIDVSERQGFEIFRVPAYNDVEAADFYQDFKFVSFFLVQFN